jgi:hypothetical protein
MLTCLLSLTSCWQGVGDGKQVSANRPHLYRDSVEPPPIKTFDSHQSFSEHPDDDSSSCSELFSKVSGAVFLRTFAPGMKAVDIDSRNARNSAELLKSLTLICLSLHEPQWRSYLAFDIQETRNLISDLVFLPSVFAVPMANS